MSSKQTTVIKNMTLLIETADRVADDSLGQVHNDMKA